jgi:hypothetical protein
MACTTFHCPNVGPKPARTQTHFQDFVRLVVYIYGFYSAAIFRQRIRAEYLQFFIVSYVSCESED